MHWSRSYVIFFTLPRDFPGLIVTKSPASYSEGIWPYYRFMQPLTCRSPHRSYFDDRYFLEVMAPDLLCLHLERSAGSRLDLVITNPHPVIHSVFYKQAHRFRKFVAHEMELSHILGHAFPDATLNLKKSRIDTHPNCPFLRFLVPIFGGSPPNLQSVQHWNVPFWPTGVLESFRHLQFISGVSTLPSFIPLHRKNRSYILSNCRTP